MPTGDKPMPTGDRPAPIAGFDTIRVAKRLETEFDVPKKQANRFASMLHRNFVGNVATKEDLAHTEEKLGGESDAVRKDVEHLTAKIDELATKAELDDLGKKIFRTMFMTSVAIVGLTVALIKFLPS